MENQKSNVLDVLTLQPGRLRDWAIEQKNKAKANAQISTNLESITKIAALVGGSVLTLGGLYYVGKHMPTVETEDILILPESLAGTYQTLHDPQTFIDNTFRKTAFHL